MPLPLLPLAIKGLFVIGKAIIAHGAVAKTGYVIAKAASIYGLSATVGGVMTVGIAVGGVVWVRDRVNHLKQAIKAIENNDATNAVIHFASLAISLHKPVDALPHAVNDYLQTIEVSKEKTQVVVGLIRDLRTDIANEIQRRT